MNTLVLDPAVLYLQQLYRNDVYNIREGQLFGQNQNPADYNKKQRHIQDFHPDFVWTRVWRTQISAW